jgi:hypothetical protein
MGSTAVEFKPETRTLLQLVKTRRTIYGLSNTCSISDEAVEAIIKDAVLHVPSSFNTQTTRVLLLLGEEHQKLWDLTLGIMEGLVAAGSVAKEMFENNTKPKLNGFQGAYGTVCSSDSCLWNHYHEMKVLLTCPRSCFSWNMTPWQRLRRSSPRTQTNSILMRLSRMLCLSI